MLVLSRKVGETIVVSDGKVEIVVVSISGKRVRLGISAPSEVAIRRVDAVSHEEGDSH